MIYPPDKRAFWMPLLNALVGFGFGYLLGLRGDPVFVGAVCAGLAWFYDHAYWMGILARMYAPPAPAPEPEAEEIAPIVYREIKCRANEGTWHRIPDDCPLSWGDLCHWAIEMNNGRKMTYREWVGAGDDKFNTPEEYKRVLDWMFSMKWAAPGGAREEAKLTDFGKCVVSDIISGSFRVNEVKQ